MAWMFSPILLSMKSTFSMPTIDAVNTCKGEKCKNEQSSGDRAEGLVGMCLHKVSVRGQFWPILVFHLNELNWKLLP